MAPLSPIGTAVTRNVGRRTVVRTGAPSWQIALPPPGLIPLLVIPHADHADYAHGYSWHSSTTGPQSSLVFSEQNYVSGTFASHQLMARSRNYRRMRDHYRLALYYTYLTLFSLLVVANQCNDSMIFTWYDKYVIKEVSCFVSFVIVKNRDHSPSIV